MSVAGDELAERIRALIGQRPGVTDKKMFGGFGFMLEGNMVVAVTGKGALMVRIAPGALEEAMSRPGAARMNMGQRTMKGFVSVTDEGIEDEDALGDWIAYAERFVRTLPPK